VSPELLNRINQAALGAIDADVDVADDGAEALRLLGVQSYDCADGHPHADHGRYRGLHRLRAGEAGRPDQPVIGLTADAMRGDAERFIRSGSTRWRLPIQPETLIAVIGAALVAAGRAESWERAT
jgi:CheY-like chemotaxis protein